MPVTYDHLCHESEIDFTIAFKPLKDLVSKRLRPTILPPSLMIVVLINHDGTMLQVSENARPLPHPHLWQDYTIQTFGVNDVRPVPPIDAGRPQSTLQVNPVESWLTNTSAAAEKPIDPFTTTDSPPAEDVSESPVRNSSPKKTTKRIRKIKGTTSEALNTRPIISKHEDSTSDGSLPHAISMNKPQGQNAAFARLKIKDERIQPHLIDQYADTSKVRTPLTHETQPQGNQSNTAVESTLLIDISLPSPPKIAPPVMPPASVASQNSQISTTWESKIASIANSASHDLLSSATPMASKTQSQDKASPKPRKPYYTMRQKAIPSVVGKAAIFKQYEDQTCEILATVRSRPGKVTLKVDIGRILLDGKTVSPQYLKRPFNQNDWTSVFKRSNGQAAIQSIFTNRYGDLHAFTPMSG